MWQAGATPHHGARASHYRGLSRCGAQAPDAQAQQLWLTGPVAPRHAGSSQTRARTRVPCTSRQILNHCATREALPLYFLFIASFRPALPARSLTHLHTCNWCLFDYPLGYRGNCLFLCPLRKTPLQTLLEALWLGLTWSSHTSS